MRPVSQQRTSPLQIDVQTQSPLWDAQPLAAQTVREAIGAAASALSTADGEVSILLTNDSAIQIGRSDAVAALGRAAPRRADRTRGHWRGSLCTLNSRR